MPPSAFPLHSVSNPSPLQEETHSLMLSTYAYALSAVWESLPGRAPGKSNLCGLVPDKIHDALEDDV